MKTNIFFYPALLILCLIFAVSCAQKKIPAPAPKVPTAVTRSPHYTSLSFEKGEALLSRDDKQRLQSLAAKARESGRDVDDIKIITWADREFGLQKGEKEASSREIILARQRAESIKRFLEEDLMEGEDVDFYNMAEKPGPLSRFFKTDDNKVKEAFNANNDANMTGPSRASKGLVIIEYETKNEI